MGRVFSAVTALAAAGLEAGATQMFITPSTGAVRLSVNLSALTLADPRFVARMVQLCRGTGVPPSSLILELTESSHPDDQVMSLRGHTQAVAEHLKKETQERQQAGAIIAARQRIAEGAVGMVEMALEMLSRKAIIELDEDRKAAMVSNLLVVLCGERSATPVINAGTIYQ